MKTVHESKSSSSRLKKAGLVVLTGMLAAPMANSQPPHFPDLVNGGNRWLITAYNDRSPVHQQWATQGLCFIPIGTNGTHTSYYWYSDTFPNWNGYATKEGDSVSMHGDYASNIGHDSMTWDIVTRSPKMEGAGHWVEWRENSGYGNTIGWINAKFRQVGYCTKSKELVIQIAEGQLTSEEEITAQAKEISDAYRDIAFPTTRKGKEITEPNGDGLKNTIRSVLKPR
ncbi:hypothetical protein CS022_13470 [Veronia nyctiphanis]|uniref:Uncharacterized protein n=1 Tax=Veronia nyctiphanis TaxID=1278244 RepID=A0A4Q0YQJ9_9GAMM|nr:hypothetical protein [Veronia nyctiphanis]RXJ72855.1 hypothetical protein CS022_13470 [Veronia nyctiphanis]